MLKCVYIFLGHCVYVYIDTYIHTYIRTYKDVQLKMDLF